jgi:hypothetical protein|tara:strand:- start:468 stop:683 length:216 start_codon:yes stop_codon:yes gene_type:complete
LLQAIRLSSAAGDVGAMSRVNDLEIVIRSDISAHNEGGLLLNKELKVLRQKNDLTDATKDLAVKAILPMKR